MPRCSARFEIVVGFWMSLMRSHKSPPLVVTNMATVARKINRRIRNRQPPYLSIKHASQSTLSSLMYQTFNPKEKTLDMP